MADGARERVERMADALVGPSQPLWDILVALGYDKAANLAADLRALLAAVESTEEAAQAQIDAMQREIDALAASAPVPDAGGGVRGPTNAADVVESFARDHPEYPDELAKARAWVATQFVATPPVPNREAVASALAAVTEAIVYYEETHDGEARCFTEALEALPVLSAALGAKP